ncbi:MAG TPA: sulfatase-like hydrolase/transferase [Thermoanaerobaculia bacterium]
MSSRFSARALLIVFVLAAAGCGREKPVAAGSFRGAPIILISIDTLRSDRLPVYGYANGQTPAIAALAADGIVFERAYSNVPLTLPSHVSMLTGLLPPDHGVRNNVGYRYDAAKHPPITASLRAEGYESAAAISSYVMRGNTGLTDAFDFYDDAIANEANVALGRLQRPGTTTLEVAKSWLDRRNDKPFFLFFHIYEPHGPYEAPEPFRSRNADPYDAEVAASDDVVRKLLEHLKAKGLYDRSMIILLSDHGEGLGDHGEDEHGVFLYREALQVPLIVKLPESARKGERVAAPVELTDIAPTIAFTAGLDPLPAWKGVNILDPKALAAERQLYAETLYPRIHLGWSELRSLMVGSHHYIEAPKPELYDLSTDPAERTNVLRDQRRVYAAMRERLSKYGTAMAAPAAVDPEEAAKLEALGYLGSVKTTEGPLPDPKDRIGDLTVLRESNRLTAEGRHKEAVAALRAMLASNPRFTDAWAKLASVYEEMGQDEEALRAYAEGVKSSPASAAEFALSMTGLYLKLNRLDEARKHAELALERNPAGAHQFLARIALQGGDFATAEREVNAAMVDEAAKPRAMVTLGQIRAAQGRMGEAVQILERTRADVQARQMRVEHLELALGDLYAKTNRLPEAEQAFRREIELFPANLTAYSSLGVVLVVQKKYDQVDPVFALMAQRNPSRRAYLVAAETYEVLGDARTASEWRRRAATAS